MTGSADAPAKVGISVADIAAGMYAYSGILTALLARTTTGEGTSLEVSLFDALGEWMGQPAYYAAYGGAAPPRSGANHASIAPYGPFARRRRRQIYSGHSECARVDALLRRGARAARLADDQRFTTNTAGCSIVRRLHAAIEAAFAPLTTSAVIARLESAGIAWARCNTVDGVPRAPAAGRLAIAGARLDRRPDRCARCCRPCGWTAWIR